MQTELDSFLKAWEQGTDGTLRLMRSLPPGQYDCRPDAGGRSLGELAWHLAEVDAYASTGIATGNFRFDVKPPNISRPKTIAELAPAFQIVHDEARNRLAPIRPADFEREIPYFDGTTWTIRDLLWRKLLLHTVHHGGQLTLLCRLAGGVPPGLFGPAREDARRPVATR
jgi:uncharacterized damage-inducible protein DinB